MDLHGNIVYESEHFIVVGYGDGLKDPDIAYEVVRVEASEHVFFYGEMAKVMVNKILAWNARTPVQEQVENFLTQVTILGRLPLRMH